MRFIIAITSLIILTGCATRFETISNKNQECGYEKKPFHNFSDCMINDLKNKQKATKNENNSPNPNNRKFKNSSNPYEDMTNDFINTLSSLRNASLEAHEGKKKAALKADKELYEEYNALVMDYRRREQQMNKEAQAIGAVLMIGAGAVALCHDGGCSNGGYGNNYNQQSVYTGNCQYSWQTAADGSRCGNRAASVRPGGW